MASCSHSVKHAPHGSKPDLNEAVKNPVPVLRWKSESEKWSSPDYKNLDLKIVDHNFAAQVARGVIQTQTFGSLDVSVHLTENYPYTPPRIFIVTKKKDKKVQHPYIHHATNEICPSIIGTNWSPAITIAKLLLALPVDVIDRYASESTMACSFATNIHNQDCMFVASDYPSINCISSYISSKGTAAQKSIGSAAGGKQKRK